jgi:hypothetical protein
MTKAEVVAQRQPAVTSFTWYAPKGSIITEKGNVIQSPPMGSVITGILPGRGAGFDLMSSALVVVPPEGDVKLRCPSIASSKRFHPLHSVNDNNISLARFTVSRSPMAGECDSLFFTPEDMYTADMLDENGKPVLGRATMQRIKGRSPSHSFGGSASRSLSRRCSIRMRPVNVITL